MLTPEELQVVKDNAKNIRFKIDGKWVAFDDDEDYINACFLAVYDRLIIVVGGESENRRLFLWKHQ